jgi:hypothetical protein
MKKKHKARIYYGPPGNEKALYWEVKVTNATKQAVINGSTAHALAGHRGMTIGCALSNAAVDNAEAFPHDVFLAVVTKSTMLLVDKMGPNGPTHAIRYGHKLAALVDANDKGTLKTLVKERPELIEQAFVIGPPRKSGTIAHVAMTPSSSRRQGGDGGSEGSKGGDDGNAGDVGHGGGEAAQGGHRGGGSKIHRGALGRAVRAGLIAKPVADQLGRAFAPSVADQR